MKFRKILTIIAITLFTASSVSAYSLKQRLNSRPKNVKINSGLSQYNSNINTCMNRYNSIGLGNFFINSGMVSANQSVRDGTNLILKFYAPEGKYSPVAITQTWSSNNMVTEFDILINFNNTFGSTVQYGTYDFNSVLMHELGHAAGLGHSSNIDATMYDNIRTQEDKKATLHQDDINGLNALY